MGDRIKRGGIARSAGEFAQHAVTHFQQAVGVQEVVIVMTDGKHRFTHLLQPRQQLAIKNTAEVRILIRRPFIQQQNIALFGNRQQQRQPPGLPF